ncbi:hypothetical protein [Mycobacterium europaeum]|uniref:hypothetical protein n=1 Tax=Mycobacterium europaeum TaxID=761804 RepID=UPI001152B24B|nr:hypothetical protein [Mycobacterium europaeum]
MAALMGDHDGLARGNPIKVPSCMGSKVTEIHDDRMRWRYDRLSGAPGRRSFWHRVDSGHDPTAALHMQAVAGCHPPKVGARSTAQLADPDRVFHDHLPK